MSATPGVTYRLSDDPEFNVVGNPPIATDERYVLDIDGDSQGITVIHSNERGRQWGEAHAQRLLAAGAVETATLDEFPDSRYAESSRASMECLGRSSSEWT